MPKQFQGLSSEFVCGARDGSQSPTPDNTLLCRRGVKKHFDASHEEDAAHLF